MPGVPTAATAATSPTAADCRRDAVNVYCCALLQLAPTNNGLSRVLNTVERKSWTVQRLHFEVGDDHHTLHLTAFKRSGDADHLVRHLSRDVVVIQAERLESDEAPLT